jgi:hypothetical protein
LLEAAPDRKCREANHRGGVLNDQFQQTIQQSFPVVWSVGLPARKLSAIGLEISHMEHAHASIIYQA